MVFNSMTIVQMLPEMEEGGVEGETFDQAVYLAKKGYNSIVISGGGRLVEPLEKAGCRHITWTDIGSKNPHCLKYITKLRQLLIDEKVDILHLRSRLPAWVAYLAWKSLPARRRPALITTFHGFYSVNRYSRIMTKGEKVVAVSQVIRDHIVSNYNTDPGKIELIHGGFDVDLFNPDRVDNERVEKLKRLWGLNDPHTPVIVLPGRLTNWKGQLEFIESLALIRNLPFIALCIGQIDNGSTFTKTIYEKISRYNLEDKVKLVGHCDDMPAAMMVADIVVSASTSQPEAFGKVAIEAMAMSKPVVATGHGGSLETVVNKVTGLLVEPGNYQDMAQAITTLLSDADYCLKLGDAGRKLALEHFTAEIMCEKNHTLYKLMLHVKNEKEEQRKAYGITDAARFGWWWS